MHKRLLEINSRALYVPCGCHSLNLVISDVATSCVRAVSFFGVLQRIYSLFSSSPERWKILKDNVSNLTVKSLSQARWESYIESVQAIRFQAQKIQDALFELAESSNDPKIKSEAKCLAMNELENFDFLLGMTIWYDILFAVNSVSKSFQSEDMHIDVAMDQLKDLLSFFETYKEKGFQSAIVSAKELANEMEVEPIFREKHVIRRKKQFDENVDDDKTQSAEESFRIDYFIYMIDQVISSLRSRFEQFGIYEKKFGFLCNFKKLKSMDEDVLKEYCLNLENVLEYDGLSDIDGLDLFLELRVLRETFQEEKNSPMEILHYIKRVDNFPNAYIAYRILFTIPVSVASAKRSFSKLKLIKSYLRSTISLERLNGLAILSIEHDLLDRLDYEDLINNFVSQNLRKNDFT
ncbi:uncharacterized protein LOC127801345 [Diospyros lotus]|uniref:uncharacterized protein LOC127801345 n=1 Tax=Diospyros lotus TaxID=55363 RepID=UPI002250246C|nr:uncharacterized protein LOC127801345 [Diospyros lotus]